MGWWYVYILRCSDNSLYTGATNDVAARLARHNAKKGARYTRARCPVRLVWTRRAQGKSKALQLEARVKALSKIDKEQLVAQWRGRTSVGFGAESV